MYIEIGGETTWTNTGATRYGRGQHKTGSFGDGMPMPSPNHGTQRLPNDDDDDGVVSVVSSHELWLEICCQPPPKLSYCGKCPLTPLEIWRQLLSRPRSLSHHAAHVPWTTLIRLFDPSLSIWLYAAAPSHWLSGCQVLPPENRQYTCVLIHKRARLRSPPVLQLLSVARPSAAHQAPAARPPPVHRQPLACCPPNECRPTGI